MGIASFNGTAAESDAYCIQAFGNATCEKFAESQKAPPTFIDRLYTAGVNVTLYGKMHVGGGLTNYPGELEDFPFSNPSKSFDTKITREWSRGILGPVFFSLFSYLYTSVVIYVRCSTIGDLYVDSIVIILCHACILHCYTLTSCNYNCVVRTFGFFFSLLFFFRQGLGPVTTTLRLTRGH